MGWRPCWACCAGGWGGAGGGGTPARAAAAAAWGGTTVEGSLPACTHACPTTSPCLLPGALGPTSQFSCNSQTRREELQLLEVVLDVLSNVSILWGITWFTDAVGAL